MSLKIEDYALIGNTRTAALVGNTGSIDWLCMPRFDSGACFAALLGTPANGRWLIGPSNRIRTSHRRYRGPTLVLENEFVTDSGAAMLIDFMPLAHQRQPVTVVRIVRGVRGSVPMRMDLAVRFDYGHIAPWITHRGYGLRAIAGPDALELVTSVPMRNEASRTIAEFTVTEGESVPFTLIWYPSHEQEPPVGDPMQTLADTEAWWQEWSSRCTITGRWRDLALRSLITLKALTYGPTGGIVAAPTTSLPEWIGGPRNWDYRFCWLRDATLTLYALLLAGYTEEAFAWREWAMRAVAGDPDDLQILYGLAGERRLPEGELPWLPGYEGSKPVRIGNAAHEQFQLDVSGEVMGAFYLGHRTGAGASLETWNLLTALMAHLEKVWNKPDEGIWEVRGGRRHFTHSKVMAWVAFDRAAKLVDEGYYSGPAERWRTLRDRIHRDVCEKGFDRRRNAFVQYYGADALDSALLMIPLVGFLPSTDPRVIGTVDAIGRELVSGGLVMRYRSESNVDGLPPGEGLFLPCSFLLVDNLVMSGRLDEAEELFERLTLLSNDVGLFSEEYDPVSSRMLGNFPQALTHVSLVNSVHNLTLVEGPAPSPFERLRNL
jgi:GH15 family glucan-1,4-alpha-glucosidase